MSTGTGLNKTTKRLKALKRVIQSEMRKAYWSFVESIITPIEDENSQSSRKRFLTFIKQCRTDTVGIKSLYDKGKDVWKSMDIANLLNDKFQSIFTTETPVPSDLLNRSSSYPEMAHIEIRESDVLKLLQRLKIHKASGPDQIRPRVLKEMADLVAPMLTTIFKKSYDCGEVPEDWKTANVTPVYKTGTGSDQANYRPISLTCMAGKLMERVLTSRIVKHANNQNIIYHLQHGFREGRSCETQLGWSWSMI